MSSQGRIEEMKDGLLLTFDTGGKLLLEDVDLKDINTSNFQIASCLRIQQLFMPSKTRSNFVYFWQKHLPNWQPLPNYSGYIKRVKQNKVV